MNIKLRQWLDARPPVEGDHVFDRRDPRHVGRLIALRPSACLVEWEATGWHSSVPLTYLERWEHES